MVWPGVVTADHKQHVIEVGEDEQQQNRGHEAHHPGAAVVVKHLQPEHAVWRCQGRLIGLVTFSRNTRSEDVKGH